MSLRAIVFDFDGVVLESADLKTEAFIELFAHHGAAVARQVETHHLANLGISRFKKFEWIYANILQQPLSDAQSQALGNREALQTLAAQLPLFVASGTPQAELDLIVERRGLRDHFREVWGTPTEKPVILRDLMSRFGLAADELLFIGDGLSDYKAAHAVGTGFLARDTAALADTWRSKAVRKSSDLRTLPAIIQGWSGDWQGEWPSSGAGE
jgi:HAD superfamily hydrolase (TIGR01549 family)